MSVGVGLVLGRCRGLAVRVQSRFVKVACAPRVPFVPYVHVAHTVSRHVGEYRLDAVLGVLCCMRGGGAGYMR